MAILLHLPLSVHGMIVRFLGAPLALGSCYAAIPALLAAGVVLVRTVLEDRLLVKQLPGYPDCARRLQYRLLPGIWKRMN